MPGPDDEGLVSAADFLEEILRLEGLGMTKEMEEVLEITEFSLDLPVEIEVDLRIDEFEDEANQSLRLQMGPPTQRIETSVMPVFHQVQLRARRVEPGPIVSVEHEVNEPGAANHG